MFTGIIEKTGKVIEKGPNRLVIEVSQRDYAQGDSISVNGICLTIVRLEMRDSKSGLSRVYFDVSDFTQDNTSFRNWRVNKIVNIEQAIRAGEKLGGHILSGHIDGIGIINSIDLRGNSHVLKITAEPQIVEDLIPRGSVAVDGISLTVADVFLPKGFAISIIPFTFNNTNLKFTKVGDRVNIELDIIGKYVKNTLETRFKNTNIKNNVDMDFLKKKGFI